MRLGQVATAAKAATLLALAASSAAGVSGQGNLRGTSCHESVKGSLDQPHQKYVKILCKRQFSCFGQVTQNLMVLL